MNAHRKIRPPRGFVVDWRLDRRWVRGDNGKPSAAFIGRVMIKTVSGKLRASDLLGLVASCRCPKFLDCVRAKVLAKAGELYGGITIYERRPIPLRKPAKRKRVSPSR